LGCGDGAGVGFGVAVDLWVGECGACGDCERAPGRYFAEEVAEFEAVYMISIISLYYGLGRGVLNSYVSNARRRSG